MPQTVLIILAVILIVLLLTRRGREAAVGICAAALDLTVRKNTNKEKVVALLNERGELSREKKITDTFISLCMKKHARFY